MSVTLWGLGGYSIGLFVAPHGENMTFLGVFVCASRKGKGQTEEVNAWDDDVCGENSARPGSSGSVSELVRRSLPVLGSEMLFFRRRF